MDSAAELPAFIIRRLPVRYTTITTILTIRTKEFRLVAIRMIEAMLDHENIEVS